MRDSGRGGHSGGVPPGASRAVLVAVAHGSTDPRASAAVAELAAVARKRSPGLDLRTAFLARPAVAAAGPGHDRADRE